MNRELQPELRSAALIALLDTVPPIATVLNVANYLKRDPSVQVAHFAYTLMKSLSTSTMPDRSTL